jgi:ketol-acid reductoisomerase
MYYEEDGDLSVIKNKRIGVVGYGNLGRPVTLNLRDADLNVRVGLGNDESRAIVEADGLAPWSIDSLVEASDIILVLLPDEVMAQVYLEKISPKLRSGHTLIFASGYTLAFGFIEPPPFVDVGMIAPRAIGAAVRERYLSGDGFYSFVAAGQDASGHVWDTILALALAMGSLRAGAFEITIEQEVELDLFVQQAILPAVHQILTTAANILLNAGYPPEAAMMDLYISGEFNDYMQRATDSGLLHALRLSSLTSQFGIFSRLERFRELKLERLMEITLDEIRDGAFAREWAREYADGYPRLRKLLKNQENMDLWELEQQTIELLRGYE